MHNKGLTLASESRRDLDWLVVQLDTHDSLTDGATVWRLLTESSLTEEDIAEYIEQRADTSAGRSVVRRETDELLVLTWLPGQRSVAHSGSLCGLKVVHVSATKQLYQSGPGGLVRATASTRLRAGQIIVDSNSIIHPLGNPANSTESFVTVHLDSPPLPEVRRYAVATDSAHQLALTAYRTSTRRNLSPGNADSPCRMRVTAETPVSPNPAQHGGTVGAAAAIRRLAAAVRSAASALRYFLPVCLYSMHDVSEQTYESEGKWQLQNRH